MRLDNKTVTLGPGLRGHNIRPETEGGDKGGDAGEPVPAKDLKFLDMPLTKNQYDGIMGEGMFDMHFNQTKNAPLEPSCRAYSRVPLDITYKNCGLKIVLGHINPKEIEIKTGVRVRGLWMEYPKVSNERACAVLRGTVTAIFPHVLATLEMEKYYDKEVRMSLRLGEVEENDEEAEAQTDLVEQAKQAEGDADADSGSEEATDKPARGRRGSTEPRVN